MNKLRLKLRLGVSQRRLPEQSHAFARDALDAAWGSWFANLWSDVQFLAIPNFDDPTLAVTYAKDWELTGFVLSGGGDVDSSPERASVEAALLDFACTQNMPVLGVCRGMQMLHRYSGGELTRIRDHVNTIHGVFTQGSWLQVNSWHDFGIHNLCEDWRSLAVAVDGSVEAMQHNRLPWLGLMWHPERPNGTHPIVWEWIEWCFGNQYRATRQ